MLEITIVLVNAPTTGVTSAKDALLATSSYSESSYAKTQNGETRDILSGSTELNNKILAKARELGINLHTGTIHSSDVFYKENNNFRELYEKYGCLCVEMESFGLFHNANVFGKNAACILTISDNLVTHEETTSLERQKKFNEMIELALETAIEL